jgi:thiamine-monophosphate kinase
VYLWTKHPWARRNLRLNQNLNREPWFATIDILNTVEFRVNPVFSTLRDRPCQPVPCPSVQVSGVVTGDGGNAFGRWAVRDEWAIRQLYCRPPVDWSSLTTSVPRKAQDEGSILRKIVDSSCSSSGQGLAKPIALGIGDDAALLRPKTGHELILTCDWFLEGTHFWRDKHPPDSVGWKCLARALSDVAAMGGIPRCFLLSLALPSTHTGRWLDLFLGGLRRASRKFRCFLAGGDTTRRNDILINVTIVGEVRTGHAIRRSGARPGDILYASGRLGEAELGLQVVRHSKRIASAKTPLMRKHLYPQPRLALGQWLTQKGLPTAMIDLSDGLSTDLSRLCAASAVGVLLDRSKIPRAKIPDFAIRRGYDRLQLALHGGDDYELLFTVPPRKTKFLPETFQGVSLTAIGRIVRGRKLLLSVENGRAMQLVPSGWDPFRKKL